MERKVTYKKTHGILFLCASLFILGTSFITGPSINTITGVLILIASILFLSNPAIVYTDDEMLWKNLFGITMKTYSFKKDKFSIQNRDIYVNGSKVRVSKSMLVTSEYDALISYILTQSTDEDLSGNVGKPKTNDQILDSDMIKK